MVRFRIFLKVEPRGFSDEVDLWYKRKRRVKYGDNLVLWVEIRLPQSSSHVDVLVPSASE